MDIKDMEKVGRYKYEIKELIRIVRMDTEIKIEKYIGALLDNDFAHEKLTQEEYDDLNLYVAELIEKARMDEKRKEFSRNLKYTPIIKGKFVDEKNLKNIEDREYNGENEDREEK